MKRKPISNHAYKIDLLEHINQDHLDELNDIAHVFTQRRTEQAVLLDIFEDGILISVEGEEKEIPFKLNGSDLHDNIEYLAYLARAKLGKSITNQKIAFFEVVDSYYVTSNMLRLVLKSDVPLDDEAGLAWNFELNIFTQQQSQPVSSLSFGKKLWNRIWTWRLRFLSHNKREQIFRNLYEGRRYYTARKVFHSGEQPFADMVWVDIYLHGETSGGLWAKQCKKGDILQSVAVYREKTAQLAEGKSVLIGDETALPTVIRLLEKWQNPQPPIIIALTHQAEDQAYVEEHTLPQGAIIHRLHYTSDTAQQIIAKLETHPNIQQIWGAFEHHQAKTVRQFARNNLKLSGKHNYVKGYWVRDIQPN